MPRYLLSEAAYLNDRIYNAGEVVDTDQVPGAHMEPALDDKGNEDRAARKAKDAAKDRNKAASPGDPAYIGQMIAHALSDGRTNGPINAQSTMVPTQSDGYQPAKPADQT